MLLLRMKNTDDLPITAYLITNMLVRFAHLVATLHALNHINVIFPPHGERIFLLTVRTNRTGDKPFTHDVYSTGVITVSILQPLFEFIIPAIELPSFLLHLALENIFQLTPCLTRPGNLRTVGIIRHQFTQHPHIQTAKM